MKYIRAVCDAGGIINTAIVIGASSGIVRRLKPEFLGGMWFCQLKWTGKSTFYPK